jgi:hypothetical protein
MICVTDDVNKNSICKLTVQVLPSIFIDNYAPHLFVIRCNPCKAAAVKGFRRFEQIVLTTSTCIFFVSDV